MVINENYLLSAGAEIREYSAGTIIFHEGELAFIFLSDYRRPDQTK